MLFNDEIPVILGGDFNCEPKSNPMKILFEQWTDSDDPSFKKNLTDYKEDKMIISFSVQKIRLKSVKREPLTNWLLPIITLFFPFSLYKK